MNAYRYEAPNVASILTLGSYIFLLNVFEYIAQWLLSAGLLGQIFIGIIFGSPLAGWLHDDWQKTFVDLGYVGLLVLVFEGGMSTDLSTLRLMLPLALVIALTGLSLPIAFSFLLTPMFGFPLTHSFAAGSALSSTSMGTVLAVLSSSSFELRSTKLGTALLGAAIFDDIVAFVLSSILEIIGGSGGNGSLSGSVGRTIGVTIGIAVVSAVIGKYAAVSFKYAWWIQTSVMALTFLALIAASGYAGTSTLYGVYIAGLVVSHLQEKDEFASAFHHHLAAPLKYLLLPLFFGSIGYSIPFISLWQGRIIWRGIIYSLLMALGKGVCGLWILVWPICPSAGEASRGRWARVVHWLQMLKGRAKDGMPGAVLIGSAMIARGEIGLLISQIAYHTQSPLLVDDEFLIVTWAIALCTICGPVGVGSIMKRWNQDIVRGGWK